MSWFKAMLRCETAALQLPGHTGWYRIGCFVPWVLDARCACRAACVCLSDGEDGPTKYREKKHENGQFSSPQNR